MYRLFNQTFFGHITGRLVLMYSIHIRGGPGVTVTDPLKTSFTRRLLRI